MIQVTGVDRIRMFSFLYLPVSMKSTLMRVRDPLKGSVSWFYGDYVYSNRFIFFLFLVYFPDNLDNPVTLVVRPLNSGVIKKSF